MNNNAMLYICEIKKNNYTNKNKLIRICSELGKKHVKIAKYSFDTWQSYIEYSNFVMDYMWKNLWLFNENKDDFEEQFCMICDLVYQSFM